MKVNFTVTAKASWSGELEMTQEEYDAWCTRIDGARGFKREYVAQDLLAEAEMQVAEADEWDEFEVDTFEAVEPPVVSES